MTTDEGTRNPMPPSACAVGVAFTATLGVAAVLGNCGAWSAGDVGLLAMTVAVGVSAWWCRPWTSLLAGALGWLMFDGFVVDQLGVLGWHGRSDAVRLAVLLGVAVAVSLARFVSVAMTQRIVLEDVVRIPAQARHA
jgi:hypothetical protein